MDELIVQVCRCIASYPRLRILTIIARRSELPPSELARELKIPFPQVCNDLRRLAAVGLIQRRHSGSRCYCQAKSPYKDTTLSGKVSRWLFSILKQEATSLHPAGSLRKRNAPVKGEPLLYQDIFKSATVFTNLRRVQILRYVATHPSNNVETLTQNLSMSPSALSRHCAKLMRRGVLKEKFSDGQLQYQMAASLPNPTLQRLLGIVRDHWAQR
jgi:DNA-binding MarR family transcriptional regulator